LDYQNNFAYLGSYLGILSMMSNTAKCFDVLATNFVALSNCFDGPTKSFLNIYFTKFLDFLQQNCSFMNIS